eukprot:scaffold518_cov388-Prasinococcus_capsulatus_cf.AAC.19
MLSASAPGRIPRVWARERRQRALSRTIIIIRPPTAFLRCNGGRAWSAARKRGSERARQRARGVGDAAGDRGPPAAALGVPSLGVIEGVEGCAHAVRLRAARMPQQRRRCRKMRWWVRLALTLAPELVYRGPLRARFKRLCAQTLVGHSTRTGTHPLSRE